MFSPAAQDAVPVFNFNNITIKGRENSVKEKQAIEKSTFTAGKSLTGNFFIFFPLSFVILIEVIFFNQLSNL
jgi:hypothetical protein